MCRWAHFGFVIGLLCLNQLSRAADDPREKIERGKAATAFVESSEAKSSATALCIDAKGLFVTNQHVVKNLPEKSTIKLILDPTSEQRQVIEAKVIRSDAQADLAILQAQGEPKTYTFLPLGNDSRLYETMTVTSFGYPFGKILAGKGEQYPDISVNVGRITALRKRDGKLDRIQLDASLNPGNSGGPVCNELGEVVAVVNSGIVATGVNFAIPVSKLREMLVKPHVTFVPPPIAAEQKHAQVELAVQIEPFQLPLDNATVELELKSEGQPPRKFTAKAVGKNEYRLNIVPIPAPVADDQPRWVPGTITFRGGSIQGNLADQTLKVGESSLKLSDIRALEWGSDAIALRHDGQKLTGPVTGLAKLPVDLGDTRVEVDLTGAKRLDTRQITKAKPRVEYVLSIVSGKEEVARQEGRLAIDGVGGEGPSLVGSTKFVPYQGQDLKLELPDTVTDAVWGAGGRLLLLHLKKTKKIAVYDVNQAKIIKYLSLGSENTLIAAGMEKLIVVAPGENVIERWSLETFEKETTRALPVNGVIKCIALGYASEGPLLIHWAKSTDALANAAYSFFDLQKFEELKIEGVRGHNSSYRDAVHIRTSGTGDVFGMWATSHSPQGMETMSIVGNKIKSSYQHDSAGHIVPNLDGSAILTGLGGVCTPEMNQKNDRTRNVPVVPTTHSRFYVSVPADPGAQINLGSKPFDGVKPAVFAVNGESRLVDLPSYELGTNEQNSSWTTNDFTLDKRVMFVPQANQLITIPFTNDRLLVKTFDMREALNKAGIDYLYVTSTPGKKYRPGKNYEYAIEVASRSGDLQYELGSGPDGMTVSKTGVVSWDVPNDYRESKVSVIVNVKSGKDQSLYETFTLNPELP